MEHTLDLDSIRRHWQGLAQHYGTDLRATTKTTTAKTMELDALSRALGKITQATGHNLTILEIGCGNGQNCLYLAEKYPSASFIGIDYIAEMIDAANSLKTEKQIPDERLVFQQGNVLELSQPHEHFDVVFTDRCLINLNTDSLQQEAIASISKLLKPNGYLLMIENCQQSYDTQNQARESVGLMKRIPENFNHFFDETTLLPFLTAIGIELVDVEDFISLHDIALYILVPMINDGKVDYDHPIVDAAARLNIAMSASSPSALGKYGQNRLYTCRKAVTTK